MLLDQSPKTEIAQVQPTQNTVVEQPAVVTPLPTAPALKKDIVVIPKVTAKPKLINADEVARNAETDKVQAAVNGASDFAAMDESLTGAESDDPVNYESLSESELESVVTIAQSMK